MENAEEVMQLLEEFAKTKPKEIPRELEDYLGYVAKTGDPVYQWSLVKHLFREKLISVITDFYESTLYTVELPTCPNVEPFNYERMKTSLLERFDTFSSAPFTVQRICELLSNPRKEYNRADKYMRAIEKNILVVSTREPGSGKRPLESDSQSETVLNGIPDIKLHESDGSLLHVPTDLPYLGAPPASNDVTVETTEPNSTVNDRADLNLDISGGSKALTPDTSSDKPWTVDESRPTPVLVAATEQVCTRSETLTTEVSSNVEKQCPEEGSCDSISRLTNVEIINPNVSPEHFEGESSSDMFTQNSETALPDSIDSSDSSQECNEVLPDSKLENDEAGSVSDENEVSSTPAETTVDTPLIEEKVDELTDSEAEATDTSQMQDTESVINSLPLPDVEINSSDRILVIETDEIKSITVPEVAAAKSDEGGSECNEKTDIVESPVSPGNNASLHGDNLVDQNINAGELEECEQPDSHPDSSNDVCSHNEALTSEELLKPQPCSEEADSMSETNVGLGPSELNSKNDCIEGAPDQTSSEILVENVSQVPTPGVGLTKIAEEECLEKSLLDPVLSSSSPGETEVTQGPSSDSLTEDSIKPTVVQSTSEVSEEMCDQERREGSIIHSAPIIPDSQQEIVSIEEINVDPSCEAEEEAMDVDDSSNQMMVTEGENEGEPMDQCDQLQS